MERRTRGPNQTEHRLRNNVAQKDAPILRHYCVFAVALPQSRHLSPDPLYRLLTATYRLRHYRMV